MIDDSLDSEFAALKENLVFKYLPRERIGLDISKSGFFPKFIIAASSPSDLNDPYECAFSFSEYNENLYRNWLSQGRPYKITRHLQEASEEAYKLLLDIFKNNKNIYREEIMRDSTFCRILDNFQKIDMMNGKLSVAETIEGKGMILREEIEKAKLELRTLIDGQWGILCFSNLYDSEEMWSHYADGGQGFIVGFSKKNMLIQLDDVKYTDTVPEINFDDKGFLCISDDLFFTKSTCWKYEKEARSILPKHFPKIPENFSKRILYEFNPDAIYCIIFGPKMSRKHKEKIFDFCKNDKRLEHVLFASSSLNMGKHKIELRYYLDYATKDSDEEFEEIMGNAINDTLMNLRGNN